MTADARVHLLAGSTGAGKTTYATKLADRIGGICFSIDEWMSMLFAADIPHALDPKWIFERVERCERQVTAVAKRILARGGSVVLDLGFQRADHRRNMADTFRDDRIEVQLHWIDVDANERWQRVQMRNDRRGETYRFDITKPVFDFIERRWEAPTQNEFRALHGVHIVN